MKNATKTQKAVTALVAVEAIRYGTNVGEVWQQAARGGNRLAMTLHFRTD